MASERLSDTIEDWLEVSYLMIYMIYGYILIIGSEKHHCCRDAFHGCTVLCSAHCTE